MGERIMRDSSRNLRVNVPSVINRPIASMRKKNLEMYCCRCFQKRRTTLLACFTICLLVLTYNALGGFMFLSIENPKTDTRIETQQTSKANAGQVQNEEVRLKTVERLWMITENLNILYKKNWTKLAEEELDQYEKVILNSVQKERAKQQKGYRTYAESFLYALTVITTIGE